MMDHIGGWMHDGTGSWMVVVTMIGLLLAVLALTFFVLSKLYKK